MDPSLKRLEEINLKSELRFIKEIEDLLKERVRDSKLPEIFFNHMAGIISEEPPSNG